MTEEHSIGLYYIPITDPTIELSVFWPYRKPDQRTEISDSISLSLIRRLTSVTCFCKHGTRDGKHVDVTSRNVPLWQTFPQFFGIKDQKQVLKSERMSEKGI